MSDDLLYEQSTPAYKYYTSSTYFSSYMDMFKYIAFILFLCYVALLIWLNVFFPIFFPEFTTQGPSVTGGVIPIQQQRTPKEFKWFF